MTNKRENINIATLNLNGETWWSINRRPRLPQKLFNIQYIKKELTKSCIIRLGEILKKEDYDVIAVQELVYSKKEREKIKTAIEKIKDVNGKQLYELFLPKNLKGSVHFTVGYIAKKKLNATLNNISSENNLSNNRIAKLKFTIHDNEYSIINMHVNKHDIDIPSVNKNTILLGDMNACSEEQTTDNKAVNAGFLEKINNAGWLEVRETGQIYTWKSNGVEKKLDHIYVYRDFASHKSIENKVDSTVNFYYDKRGFTDHSMLTITLE